MKTCSTCKIDKDTSGFSVRAGTKDGYAYSCRECAKTRSQSHYGRHKDEYIKRSTDSGTVRARLLTDWRKTQKCMCCPEDDDACMDFHHVDPTQRETNVPSLTSYSMSRILVELSKCVLVCVNCHRKIHAYGLEQVAGNNAFVENHLSDSFKQYVEQVGIR